MGTQLDQEKLNTKNHGFVYSSKWGKSSPLGLGQHCYRSQDFLSQTSKKCYVLITSVNPKMFSGIIYLNTSPATRFYCKDDLEETNYLSDTTQEDHNYPLIEHDMTRGGSSIHTISQIQLFLNVKEPQVKEFHCKAKIVDIVTRKSWYTISCSKCYNQISTLDNKFTRHYCEDPNITGVIRFRVEAIVDDQTDRVSFILFDDAAKKITETTAEDLVDTLVFSYAYLIPS